MHVSTSDSTLIRYSTRATVADVAAAVRDEYLAFLVGFRSLRRDFRSRPNYNVARHREVGNTSRMMVMTSFPRYKFVCVSNFAEVPAHGAKTTITRSAKTLTDVKPICKAYVLYSFAGIL